jgi:biotin operon repressor
MNGIVKFMALAFGIAAATPAIAADIDWSKVDQALGKKGAMLPGEVYKVGLPRTDLHVTLDGVDLKPAFALGSHIEFKATGNGAMLMGDLVLTEDEVNPVMKKLTEGGVEITAVHNHLLRMSPQILYMHVGGEGDPVKLAETLHAALLSSKTPFATPVSTAPAPTLDLDTTAIDQTLGAKGTANGGVYQFGIPRAETIKAEGMIVPPAMGTAIAVNFQPTGSGKAAITGDFVLLAKEVNPVLNTLRENGIEVTALHSHMLYDEPHLFFMHFWANDDAMKLAKGLRAALDKVNIKKDQN